MSVISGRESANRGFDKVEEVMRVYRSCEILIADIKINVEDLTSKPECFVRKSPSGNLTPFASIRFVPSGAVKEMYRE